MQSSDLTLTSPAGDIGGGGAPLLTLTIVWHPDLGRVGEQYIDTRSEGVQLSRAEPSFRRPFGTDAPLLYGGISRQPVHVVPVGPDAVELRVPESRMVVELDGQPIQGTLRLDSERIDAGVMLGLGRAVLLCLHWTWCLPRDNPVPGLLGVGSAATQVRALIHAVAATDVPVLLLGETGCGKEVAASAIHALSRRRAAPLVAVNMATLNETLAAAELFGAAKGAYTGAQATRGGFFAEAGEGTLFLDEIGNTPPPVQAMLLRVLEGGHYRPVGASRDERSNARLIAATDQDLNDGVFNQPLLRRLEQFVIQLPPLRARREDIGVLIAHFLERHRQAEGRDVFLPYQLVSSCATYDWPGNIRQLMHLLGRAALAVQLGETPEFDKLARSRPSGVPAARPVAPAPPKPSALSEQAILRALDNNGWHIQGAARELGISRPSLYKLIGAHSCIRRPEDIEAGDLRAALDASAGVLENCAARLRTPVEALRRHLRALAAGG
jgi:transcriptional regulator with AAA-type ATPase domain